MLFLLPQPPHPLPSLRASCAISPLFQKTLFSTISTNRFLLIKFANITDSHQRPLEHSLSSQKSYRLYLCLCNCDLCFLFPLQSEGIECPNSELWILVVEWTKKHGMLSMIRIVRKVGRKEGNNLNGWEREGRGRLKPKHQ